MKAIWKRSSKIIHASCCWPFLFEVVLPVKFCRVHLWRSTVLIWRPVIVSNNSTKTQFVGWCKHSTLVLRIKPSMLMLCNPINTWCNGCPWGWYDNKIKPVIHWSSKPTHQAPALFDCGPAAKKPVFHSRALTYLSWWQLTVRVSHRVSHPVALTLHNSMLHYILITTALFCGCLLSIWPFASHALTCTTSRSLEIHEISPNRFINFIV